jgi:beta-galactosidase beta subunit
VKCERRASAHFFEQHNQYWKILFILNEIEKIYFVLEFKINVFNDI